MTARVTVDLLQALVETEAWKSDTRLITWILNEYSTLAVTDPEAAQNFGTIEFWDAVLGDDESDNQQTGQLNFLSKFAYEH